MMQERWKMGRICWSKSMGAWAAASELIERMKMAARRMGIHSTMVESRVGVALMV